MRWWRCGGIRIANSLFEKKVVGYISGQGELSLVRGGVGAGDLGVRRLEATAGIESLGKENVRPRFDMGSASTRRQSEAV